MKNILIAGLALVLSALTLGGCKHDPSKHHAPAAGAAAAGTAYICPMNCENGKIYDRPGACPVCNMDLEPVQAETAAQAAEYFTAFASTPAQLEVGKPGLLSFTPKIKGNESAPVPLDLVHEKKMHLILVSDDLSWFDHIHPEYSASGSYDIKVLGRDENFTRGRGQNETRFDAGGKYWAFADYKPSGGLNQVHKTELQIAGKPAPPAVYSKPKTTSVADGYTVRFETGSAPLAAGNPQHIPVTIAQGSAAVDPAGFENYLGEKAHLVLVEVQSKAFVHTHPSAEGGRLNIHTTFPGPGTYRGWLQFQTAGKVHTADVVLQVVRGQAAPAAGEGHSGH